jgi:hypothetical protein
LGGKVIIFRRREHVLHRVEAVRGGVVVLATVFDGPEGSLDSAPGEDGPVFGEVAEHQAFLFAREDHLLNTYIINLE